MTTPKEFDCVEYKFAVQQRHIAETQGLSPEQKAQSRRRWLKESSNPAAKLWREMAAKQAIETVGHG